MLKDLILQMQFPFGIFLFSYLTLTKDIKLVGNAKGVAFITQQIHFFCSSSEFYCLRVSLRAKTNFNKSSRLVVSDHLHRYGPHCLGRVFWPIALGSVNLEHIQDRNSDL